MATKTKNADDTEVEAETTDDDVHIEETAIATGKTTDYMGRALITPASNSKDYLGRATTATADHLGRLLLA